jgi:hypothetical protein
LPARAGEHSKLILGPVSANKAFANRRVLFSQLQPVQIYVVIGGSDRSTFQRDTPKPPPAIGLASAVLISAAAGQICSDSDRFETLAGFSRLFLCIEDPQASSKNKARNVKTAPYVFRQSKCANW